MAIQCSGVACLSAFLLLVALSGSAVEGLYPKWTTGDDVDCAKLPPKICAFAVDAYGSRCVLEPLDQYGRDARTSDGQCLTSDVLANRAESYLESQECLDACGVKRRTMGIPDALFFNPVVASKLCSVECQMNCSNMVDAFSSHISGVNEGVSLVTYCNEFHKSQGFPREVRGCRFTTTNLPALLEMISPLSSNMNWNSYPGKYYDRSGRSRPVCRQIASSSPQDDLPFSNIHQWKSIRLQKVSP